LDPLLNREARDLTLLGAARLEPPNCSNGLFSAVIGTRKDNDPQNTSGRRVSTMPAGKRSYNTFKNPGTKVVEAARLADQ
jgi:hypothetical protein